MDDRHYAPSAWTRLLAPALVLALVAAFIGEAQQGATSEPAPLGQGVAQGERAGDASGNPAPSQAVYQTSYQAVGMLRTEPELRSPLATAPRP
jgi:hypothetical protein